MIREYPVTPGLARYLAAVAPVATGVSLLAEGPANFAYPYWDGIAQFAPLHLWGWLFAVCGAVGLIAPRLFYRNPRLVVIPFAGLAGGWGLFGTAGLMAGFDSGAAALFGGITAMTLALLSVIAVIDARARADYIAWHREASR